MEVTEQRPEAEEVKERQGFQFVLLGDDQKMFPNVYDKEVQAKLTQW